MGIKHTPGPWKATKFNPSTGEIDDCYLYVEPGIAVIERKVKGHDQHDTYNTRLIAAAPDLLEALYKLVLHVGHYSSMPHAHPDAARDMANARAAIAKAEGFQPV